MTQESVIARRLAQARHELQNISAYEYALVNDQLDLAATEMRAVVLCERGEAGEVRATASHCRTDAPSARLRSALASFETTVGA